MLFRSNLITWLNVMGPFDATDSITCSDDLVIHW